MPAARHSSLGTNGSVSPAGWDRWERFAGLTTWLREVPTTDYLALVARRTWTHQGSRSLKLAVKLVPDTLAPSASSHRATS